MSAPWLTPHETRGCMGHSQHSRLCKASGPAGRGCWPGSLSLYKHAVIPSLHTRRTPAGPQSHDGHAACYIGGVTVQGAGEARFCRGTSQGRQNWAGVSPTAYCRGLTDCKAQVRPPSAGVPVSCSVSRSGRMASRKEVNVRAGVPESRFLGSTARYLSFALQTHS